MPLHVARLRDSDFAAEEDPAGCWYGVLLWSASWHQLPAGSLPDNDAVLMRLVGLGRDSRTWKKHRDAALRNFVKCADGRLYHPVVAELVKEAWTAKLEQRWRTECARIRKANERNKTDDPKPTLAEFLAARHATEPVTSHKTRLNVPRDTTPPVTRDTPEKSCDIGSKGQGQGQTITTQPPPTSVPGATEPEPDAEREALLNRVCRAAAWVPPTDAKRREALGVLDGWVDGGFSEEAILAGIGQARAEKPGRTGSLRRFTTTIAMVHDKRAPAKPPTPAPPMPTVRGIADEPPELAPMRSALLERHGKRTFEHWFGGVRFDLTPLGVEVVAPSRFRLDQLQQRRDEVEGAARAVTGFRELSWRVATEDERELVA